MKADLQKIFEKYVQASNNADVQQFLSCFSATATVHDEGETRSGFDEIGRWFKSIRAKYKFKTELLSLEESGKNVTMTAKVTGDFPGSPVNLSYQFKMNSGLIQDLRIS